MCKKKVQFPEEFHVRYKFKKRPFITPDGKKIVGTECLLLAINKENKSVSINQGRAFQSLKDQTLNKRGYEVSFGRASKVYDRDRKWRPLIKVVPTQFGDINTYHPFVAETSRIISKSVDSLVDYVRPDAYGCASFMATDHKKATIMAESKLVDVAPTLSSDDCEWLKQEVLLYEKQNTELSPG